MRKEREARAREKGFEFKWTTEIFQFHSHLPCKKLDTNGLNTKGLKKPFPLRKDVFLLYFIIYRI